MKKEKKSGLKIRVTLYSLILILLSWLYFSNELKSHHTISSEKQYFNILIIAGLTLIAFLTRIFAKKIVLSKRQKAVELTLAVVMMSSAIAYTLLTEKPNKNESPERATMTRISNFYDKAELDKFKTYVNHAWFYWANNYDRVYDESIRVTQGNLIDAPDSSIIVWENHYSTRLSGDVPSNYFDDKKEFVELVRQISSDGKFLVRIFQKLPKVDPNTLENLLTELIKVDSTIGGIYFNRANNRAQRLRKFDLAVEDYNRAIDLDSGDVNSYFNKGLILINQRKFKQGARAYKEVVKLRSEYYQAFFNLAVCLGNIKGKENQAMQKFKRVVELKPDYGDAYYNLGVLQLRANKRNEGCENLKLAKKHGRSGIESLIGQYCK